MFTTKLLTNHTENYVKNIFCIFTTNDKQNVKKPDNMQDFHKQTFDKKYDLNIFV